MSYSGGRHGQILGDEKRGDELMDMVGGALAGARAVMAAGAAAYVCFTWRTWIEFETSMRRVGFRPDACIVWDKGSIGLGNQHYRPQHEFIFFQHDFLFYAKGERWRGGKAESDVWTIHRAPVGTYVHPTQKPVELIERALGNSSLRGDTVLDVFGGSGSTLIACERMMRRARLVELDPKYVDVIVRRWQDFSGKQASLEGGGSFETVRDERTRDPGHVSDFELGRARIAERAIRDDDGGN
jgi:DNA modification methylase